MITPRGKENLLDLSPADLETWLRGVGQASFRAVQIRDWLYRRRVFEFAEMNNLPATLRDALAAHFHPLPARIITQRTSADGSTTKALLGLADGTTVESVLMRQAERSRTGPRHTVCVSSQVGCPVGCPFCATGRSGFTRGLTAGEMVAQVLLFARLLRSEGAEHDVDNVVFMGQGEPLLNLVALRRALDLINSPQGLGLGARHLTVSTAGVVPGIRAVADWPLQIGLAVSLHAPNDHLRDQLVPLNRKYPISVLMDTCREYTKRTGRRVTYEYTLIGGVNDAAVLARELAGLLRGQLCHVNLIPVNPSVSAAHRPPSGAALARFRAELRQGGIPCSVRRERGADIDAACGQLRRAGAGPSPRRP